MTSFFKSIFLGAPGTYNIAGISTIFTAGVDNSSCKFFHLAILGNFYTFIHEMGHALAARWVANSTMIAIVVYTNGSSTNGASGFCISQRGNSRIRDSLIYVAGPLARALCATVQTAVTVGLIGYLAPKPKQEVELQPSAKEKSESLLKRIRKIVKITTFYLFLCPPMSAILSEVEYACGSLDRKCGDFFQIQQNSGFHLMGAAIVLSIIGVVALSLLAVAQAILIAEMVGGLEEE